MDWQKGIERKMSNNEFLSMNGEYNGERVTAPILESAFIRLSMTRANEERSPSVTRSFYWDIAYFVELDELVLVVCFVFPHRPLQKNASIIYA